MLGLVSLCTAKEAVEERVKRGLLEEALDLAVSIIMTYEIQGIIFKNPLPNLLGREGKCDKLLACCF